MKEQQSLPLEVESKQVIAWSVTISLILFQPFPDLKGIKTKYPTKAPKTGKCSIAINLLHTSSYSSARNAKARGRSPIANWIYPSQKIW